MDIGRDRSGDRKRREKSRSCPDASLDIDQLRNGDEAALRRFIRDYRAEVYRDLHSFTGGHPDAEDLAQTVLVQACRTIQDYDPALSSLRTWLHVITRTRWLDWRRRQKETLPLREALQVADPHADAPFEAVRVLAALATLPAEKYEVSVLFYLEGYTITEIAQKVDRPAGTLKRWMSEARKQLQEEWGTDPKDDPGGTTR